MNAALTWSLDELYLGLDDPAFAKDFQALQTQIKELDDYTQTEFQGTKGAAEKIEGYLTRLLALSAYSTLGSFLSLTLSTDSTNSEANKQMDRLEAEYANLSAPSTRFKEFLGQLTSLEEITQASPLLKEHTFYLEETYQNSKHTASQQEEQLLARLLTTGSSAWNNQYNALTSTVLIPIDLDGQPEKMTLSAIRNLAYHPDQSTRKTAYLAELEGYKQIEQAIANSLNAIKGEALITADLRDYSSILEMTLASSRMDRQTLDAMWEAIIDALPDFRQYFYRKAQLLGHEKGLPFYDLFAPIGDAEMEMSYQQAQDFIVENFSDFNPEMGAFAKHAFDNRWIDVYPREGKRGGAFCHTVHPIQESRIMTNYSDSFEGVLTLGHELGHAYHGKCLREQTSLNASYPMPIAETASTFCETLLIRSALKTASPEQSISMLESYLVGVTQVIIDIYSRYLFEDALIRERSGGPLSVQELNDTMLEAQRTAYGDGLDPDYLHPSMWICKPHYYSAGRAYYNFPYAYGLLFALGLYSQYQKEGKAFLPKYDAILKATGRMNLYDVGQLAGIDVRSKAFWKSSLDIALEDIKLFLELTK